MKDKYPFFRYVTGDSKIHKLNSKMKIAWFLLSILLILILNDYISSLLIFLYLLFIMKETKIPLLAYFENTLLIWIVYVLGFVITFLISCNVLLSCLITIKLMFIIILFLILTFTTSLSEIAWGFECLFLRLKKIHVPVSKISLKISLGIKFVATLFEQSKTIRKSMAYRGVSYSDSKFKTFKKMFFPIIRLSYKLSLRTGTAMRLRFYSNLKRRTNYHENKTTKFDKFLIVNCFVLIYLVIWLGWLK